MRILLTHRYFWPDTAPYSLMLRTIGDALADEGHEIHVFASIPSYRGRQPAVRRERLGALDITRCWVFSEYRKKPLIRFANLLLYCLALIFHILRLRPDVVTASTFPPIVAGWSASLASRIVGAKFIYHMQDVHPEVSMYSGGWLGRGVIFKVMRWMDNKTLLRAVRIIVLSQDMADTLRKRGIGPLPITVINNFLLEGFDPAVASTPEWLSKKPGMRRIIFAGNLGRFQNLPLLTEGVAQLFGWNPDLELLLLGDGDAEAELKARWGGNPHVRFAPFLPYSQARSLIAEADLGLVSLTPDIYKVSYPSKLLTYLGLGVPVLALVEPESALAQEVIAKRLGAVPASATPAAIADAAAMVLRGEFKLGLLKSEFSAAKATAKWVELLREL
jgi:colanic acid biosynthesis glycosyl transferase WcaI